MVNVLFIETLSTTYNIKVHISFLTSVFNSAIRICGASHINTIIIFIVLKRSSLNCPPPFTFQKYSASLT